MSVFVTDGLPASIVLATAMAEDNDPHFVTKSYFHFQMSSLYIELPRV